MNYFEDIAQTVYRLLTGRSLSTSRGPSADSPSTTAAQGTVAPARRSSVAVVATVPQVARTSSMITTDRPAIAMPSSGTLRVAVPYLSWQVSLKTAAEASARADCQHADAKFDGHGAAEQESTGVHPATRSAPRRSPGARRSLSPGRARAHQNRGEVLEVDTWSGKVITSRVSEAISRPISDESVID